jgi:hypothetical protein
LVVHELYPISFDYAARAALPKNTDAELMPKPWFQATTREWNIEHGFSGNYRVVVPDFQRGAVWTEAQAIRFIESIWGGMPLGTYCKNLGLDTPYEGWLLDGQQRWNAIRKYVNGDLVVHGRNYLDLHFADRRRFMSKPFHCLEVDIEDAAVLEEIFNRLAFGGTPNNPA